MRWKAMLLCTDTPIASLCVDGQTIVLSRASMRQNAPGCWEQTVNGLTIALEYEAFEDFGGAAWVCRLRNDDETDSPRISAQFGLDLSLPVEGDARWESLDGDACAGKSFLPLCRSLSDGDAFSIEPTGGRSSSVSAFPYFDLVSGDQALTCAIGWSGQWKLDVSRTGDTVRLCASIADADFFLHPGETARMPRIFAVAGERTVEENRRVFRRGMFAHFSPATRLGSDLHIPVSLQNFDRYFSSDMEWRTEPRQRKELHHAAECGFDTYWLDAAWFKHGFPYGVGNYCFDAGFPNGLRGLSDLAHEKGMQFMLWFEPARVYEGSEVAVNHPEFLLHDPAYWDPKTRLYNLGDPAAFAWLLQTIGDFIENNGVDVYREDYNIDPLSYWRLADEPGRSGLTEIRFIEGMYALWDGLVARFPGLLIDNCASGGRRLDLECAARALPCWRSDTGCYPPSSEKPIDLWNQNQTLGLTRYLPYHGTSTWSSGANYVRSGATDGLAMNIAFDAPDYDPAIPARALDEVRQFALCWHGDFYPHTIATLSPEVWCSYQFDLPDGGSGYAAAFRRENASDETYAIPFVALDPQSTYRVTVIDEAFQSTEPAVHTGAALMQGFPVQAGLRESVLVAYQKI